MEIQNNFYKLIILFVIMLVSFFIITCSSDSDDHVTNENHKNVHWGYEGEGAPAQWGKLDPKYAACSNGVNQSPINIDTTSVIKADLPNIQINYQASTLNVVNNGHTIQASPSAGNYIEVNGTRFDLLQFHFHASSEHTVQGSSYPLEVHFVHQNADGELAVIGVFIKEGSENQAYNQLWENLPAEENAEFNLQDPLNLGALLPADQRTYRYTGSLTTPPCSEIVSWMVIAAPIEMSLNQIHAFKAIFNGNFRPVQPLNGRYVVYDSSVN